MKTYTLDATDWPLILNNANADNPEAVAVFNLPPDSSGDDAAGLERLALARAAAIAPQLVRALQWAAAFVGCFTGDGAGPNPPDWPRLENGDPDPEAIARECFRVLALAGAPTR